MKNLHIPINKKKIQTLEKAVKSGLRPLTDPTGRESWQKTGNTGVRIKKNTGKNKKKYHFIRVSPFSAEPT
jgi:hypothetical protein